MEMHFYSELVFVHEPEDVAKTGSHVSMLQYKISGKSLA